MKRGCIFCGFISGKRKAHANGMPFHILHDTGKSISFLDQCQPPKESHVLIVPKVHIEGIEHVPGTLMQDVMKHAGLIASAMKRSHGGCNILVNEGKAAGQCIRHVHVHVLSRDLKDGITMEKWKQESVSSRDFQKRYDLLKKAIDI